MIAEKINFPRLLLPARHQSPLTILPQYLPSNPEPGQVLVRPADPVRLLPGIEGRQLRGQLPGGAAAEGRGGRGRGRGRRRVQAGAPKEVLPAAVPRAQAIPGKD